MEALAIIPARGGSKSIPMKNIAMLAGKPLIAYSIEVAQQSHHISRLVVSTDCEEIRDISLRYGAEVPFLRPTELAQDDTPDLPVFIHVLERLKENQAYSPEIVVHLRPTTPLRKPGKIDEAIERLVERPEADSVRSVSLPLQNPFKMWKPGDPFLRPLIDLDVREPYNQPRQKLPVAYWQNGYVDVARVQTILSKKSMTGERILPYVMEEQFVIDIDQPFSLELAEIFLQHGEY